MRYGLLLNGFCCLIALCAMPGTAQAEQRALVLSWSGPHECPSGDRVVARVEQLSSKRAAPTTPFVATGKITKEPHRYRLELSIAERDGGSHSKRDVDAVSCDELADAAALILALWMDPTRPPEREQGVRATAPSLASRQPPPERAARRAASPEPRFAPRWGVFAGPVADYGLLPTVAPGLELGGRTELGRFMLGVAGTWLPYSKREISRGAGQEPPKGGTFSLLSGALRACYRVLERTKLTACWEGELGAISAEGYGTAVDSHRNVPWAAVGPGAETSFPVSENVLFRIATGVRVAWYRPAFVLENVGSVHRPAPVSLRLNLGMLVRFP